MRRSVLYVSVFVLSITASLFCGCDLPGEVLCNEQHLEDASVGDLLGRLTELGFEDLSGLFGDDE